MEPKYIRLLSALQSGAVLTAKQISSRFRVSQPYDLVFRLRTHGYDIRLLPRTNSKGETRNFYKLMQATRPKLYMWSSAKR